MLPLHYILHIAEAEGIEPPRMLLSPVFKTSAVASHLLALPFLYSTSMNPEDICPLLNKKPDSEGNRASVFQGDVMLRLDALKPTSGINGIHLARSDNIIGGTWKPYM